MKRWVLAGVTTAAILVTGTQSSQAVPISLEQNVAGAISFNDQTSLSDQTSFAGVDLSAVFRFEAESTDTTGTISVEVTNASDAATTAIMTAIGINVEDGLFSLDSFAYTNQGSGSSSFSACTTGCGLNGFVTFDLAADRDNGRGGVDNGLNIGETGLFEWNVSFAAGALDSVTDFFDIFDAELIDNTLLHTGDAGTDVNSFWVAHMQSVANFDPDNPGCTEDCGGSLKIGGTVNDVPEPGAIALFGIGLIGIGSLMRRRKSV